VELTAAIYDRLSGDPTLAGMLADYRGAPGIFTSEPVPGDASLPYIVTAGQAVDAAWDTKTTRGRRVWRDVRCYAAASGSAVLVEEIAERVRVLLHRYRLLGVADHETVIAEASGPILADEDDAQGRVITIRLTMQEV
jgi:hypothetical protein